MSTTAIAEQQAKTKRLPQPKLLTYNDYARLTPPDSGNYELHNGKIIFMASPLAPHQIASSNLHTEMGYFVKRNQLGRILSAPMDVRFTPNDVVQPDLMFIRNERLDIIQRIVEGAPDLVIEIKSGSNTTAEMVYKKYLYEVSGVQEYWIVYPNQQTVRQYELIDDELHHVRTLTTKDTLDSLVLAGFSMPVSAIFE
jgi:Uma2 family endonuclease